MSCDVIRSGSSPTMRHRNEHRQVADQRRVSRFRQTCRPGKNQRVRAACTTMTDLLPSPDLVRPPDADPVPAPIRLFAASWALVTILHLLGNADQVASATTFSGERIGQAILALTAIGVLLRPSDLRRLIVLATAGVVTVWLEAPMLSNHWLVAGMVNLAIIGSALVVLRRHRRLDPAELWRLAAPTMRASVLVFYACAAFAKLNKDFFDPAVSCGAEFFKETSHSIGLGALADAGGRSFLWAAILATAAIELSVPLLLVVRRTRHAGVVVALVFHFVVALDQWHQFFDFSGLLMALYLLFLPAGFAAWLLLRIQRRPAASAIRQLIVAVSAALLVLAFIPKPGILTTVFTGGREVLWLALSLPLIVAVIMWLRRERPAPIRRPTLIPARVLWVIPALVLLNGLSPYLEVKSAFGFTMYSNLRIANGRTNHLVVRRTAPLSDVEADVVRILDSSDSRLREYGRDGYGVTWRQLRAYAVVHHNVAIHYIRHGVDHDLARASDAPDLVAPMSIVDRKVFVFRAIDLHGRERCQARWGVAR